MHNNTYIRQKIEDNVIESTREQLEPYIRDMIHSVIDDESDSIIRDILSDIFE